MEGLFDKLAGFVGFADINFESEEFSKRFHVKSDDKQFAYALIHPQMMEWLQPQQFHGQLERGLWVMQLGGRHTAEDCQAARAQAVGFIDRIPDFVWQDYGKREPVKLPEPAPFVPPAPATAGIEVVSADDCWGSVPFGRNRAIF